MTLLILLSGGGGDTVLNFGTRRVAYVTRAQNYVVVPGD